MAGTALLVSDGMSPALNHIAVAPLAEPLATGLQERPLITSVAAVA